MTWPLVLTALPAFLVEAVFYASLGSEALRRRLEKLPEALLAALLTASAVIPYCLATAAFGTFSWTNLGWIALLSGAASFWFVALPKKPASDVLLLVFMATVWIAALFKHWYVCPYPKLQLPVLGQLMWFRTGLFAFLSIRKVQGVGFGFFPSAEDWKIGALHYAAFVPVAAVVAHFIHFANPRWPQGGWEKAIATFFGILWVVALAEEFFFRGLLQQWLTKWSNATVGLIAASLLFGSVHLFYHQFPNWRFAILASLAGLFYGAAFNRAKSIKASMVAHALVVTTWKLFFA